MGQRGNAFDDEMTARILRSVRWTEAQGRDLTVPSRRHRPAADGKVRFGRPSAAFSSGSTIGLVETDGLGNDFTDDAVRNVHVGVDAGNVTASFSTGDVLRWRRYASPVIDGGVSVVGVLVGLLYTAPATLFIGEVKALAGPYDVSGVPSGWLWCDGSEKSKTTYSDLFAVIGKQWDTCEGVDPPAEGFFRLPPGGLVWRGYKLTDSDYNAVGDWGGYKEACLGHTHTATEPGVEIRWEVGDSYQGRAWEYSEPTFQTVWASDLFDPPNTPHSYPVSTPFQGAASDCWSRHIHTRGPFGVVKFMIYAGEQAATE